MRAKPSPSVACTCRQCGAVFSQKWSRVAIGKGRYCSKPCANTGKTTPLPQRLWRQVDYGGTGCWLWTGAVDWDGYGMITIGTHVDHHTEHATRVIWFLIHGAYPRFACHTCDTPRCCRPSHLFDGTPLENMRDMWRKGRARPTGRRRQAATLPLLGPE